jgi:DsbC/DsbD-like thiol-disulfide interchange protein/cytochrome c biogenesis protein CcdA
MMRVLSFLLTVFGALWLSATGVMAQDSLSVGRSSNVEVTLKSAQTTVVPGRIFNVAIEQKIAPGWHTYWRNPGDSGEPTDIKWTLSSGVTASNIKWPAPTAIPFGPLVNYGFSDKVMLPVEIKVPDSAKAGDVINLVADVRWLECSDICIPGEARIGLDVKVGTSPVASADEAAVAGAHRATPPAFTGETRLTDLGAGGLQLVIKGVDTPSKAYFFPYEIKLGAVVDFAAPQALVRGKDGFGLTLVKSPSFPADLKGPVGGVLVMGDGPSAKAFIVSPEFEAAPVDASPVPPVVQADPTPVAAPPVASVSLIGALGLALLGGLILNLMPCVFPILSMKALGLLEAAHSDAKAARAHGLWYGGGVIVSFLALAGILIGLSSAGNAVGWGFQLQSPIIVIGLAVLMVLIGFNLLGFFEIGTSLQGIGGDVAHGKTAQGSFLTGILAVIVAAPCTAPFMGAALGFAATQTPPIALLVFAALGLGFALPFVVLTFTPRLMRALPKPGPWMVTLREGLAFPMFATSVWLIWVVTAQAGQTGILAALVCIVAAAFGVWLSRIWQGLGGKIAGALLVIASLVWAGSHLANASEVAPSTSAQQDDSRWSPARVAQLQAQGKTVFVNFTADWCVTCKVNEVSVFSNPAVKAALNGDKAVYLIADWTKRDNAIAQALASHGRVGVPLYLVYTPEVATPVILPQILSVQSVLEAIK